MAVPVLIPARNEERHIAATLRSLPDEVEPFVIPNGCTDDTAAIAEDLGATILEGSKEGKLPALQFAIDYLGERALEPFVCLDADSRPKSPKKWLGALLSARAELDPQRPAMITGSHLFTGLNPIQSMLKNRRWRSTTHKHHIKPEWGMSGANILLDLQGEEVLQAVQKLPNIWPGEDSVLREVIAEHGGELLNTINPKARVLTDASDRLYLKNTQTLMFTYEEDAPPHAVSYWQFQAQRELALILLPKIGIIDE
jgi:glycosyltransferase involved in cell wall biosynthesis